MRSHDPDQPPRAPDQMLFDFAARADMTQSMETSLTDLHRHVDQLADAWQVRDVVTLRALVQRCQQGARQRGLSDIAAAAAAIDEALSLHDEAESSEITESIESLILMCTRAVTGEGRGKR